MDHQGELEKAKYRNWVRGILSYKYLKQGIEVFADDAVLQEHNRILRYINYTHGVICNRCSLRSFRPKHAAMSFGCPWGQTRCGCMDKRKKPCPNNVCDGIYEEILKYHGSNPPSPYWKNTDMQRWCSDPWEVAKCFINSPGYSNKTGAADIDAAGLLHLFINNVSLHARLACCISGTDVFCKALERRNTIFHSPTMELEERELNDCIEDIIVILEDTKELKMKSEAKQAVQKLRQLKDKTFVITTNDETEVCREAMISINNKSEELKEMIEAAKTDIDNKTGSLCKAAEDKAKETIENQLKQIENRNVDQSQAMKHEIKLLDERLRHVETDTSYIKQHLSDIERTLEKLDRTRYAQSKKLQYLEQKQALQRKLAERYVKDYIKTWISPLKTQDNNVDINEVYVAPNMIVEEKIAICHADDLSEIQSHTCHKKFDFNASTIGAHTHDRHRQKLIENTPTHIDRYKDLFQTSNVRHKKIYIIGEVGAGKSSMCKMMIFNWCKAVRHNIGAGSTELFYGETIEGDNIREMKKFDFLFTIPLQRMSGLSSDIRKMIKSLCKDLATEELIDSILNEDSEHCLVIADGLDEWSPPKQEFYPQHVTYGIPVSDNLGNATVVTLSRPSARGILNLKKTEYDRKIELLGVPKISVVAFIKKYMRKLNPDASFNDFMRKMLRGNLEHLEKSPLILQQLVWMYCAEIEIGTSVCDLYCNIVNIMFAWSQETTEVTAAESETDTLVGMEQMHLPELLRRFPRCEEHQKIIFLLGKASFEAITEDVKSGVFGRSKLRRYGLSRDDLATLIKTGILVEYNSLDPTYEKTYLSFSHISYLEFFAAVYLAGHYQDPMRLTSAEQQNTQRTTPLEELLTKFTSIGDILKMSNLLKMVCGLYPLLLDKISRLISENMKNDHGMIRYREELPEPNLFGANGPGQVQRLIYDCITECISREQTSLCLCDVVILHNISISFLRKINPESVRSVCIYRLSTTPANAVDVMKWISELSQLQSLRIDDNLSCDAYKQVCVSISKLTSLRQISLLGVICEHRDLHTIDVSKLHQLCSIRINYSSCLIGSEVNSRCLKNVDMKLNDQTRKTPHVICETLSETLTQAVSMKTLRLGEITCDISGCFGHSLDLSKHDQLQSVDINYCSIVLGSVLNSRCLEYVSITDTRRTHVKCGSLSSLSDATNLKELDLRNVGCGRPYCKGHLIEVPTHNQLQSVQLSHCSFLLSSVFNAQSLSSLSIIASPNRSLAHTLLCHLSLSISKAVSLTHLALLHNVCENSSCKGHTIDLSKNDRLQSIELVNTSCTIGSVMNNTMLQKFFLTERQSCRTTHDTCENISTSLTRAKSMRNLVLLDVICDRDFCESHVSDLSDHNELRHVQVRGTRLVSKLNTESLDRLDIAEVSNATSLLQSCYNSGLDFLSLCKIKYTMEISSVVQSLQYLCTLNLEYVTIETNSLIGHSRMRYLEEINLHSVAMDLDTWDTFVYSLLTIAHPVWVRTHQMSVGQGQNAAAREFVERNKDLFKVTFVSSMSFTFKTKRRKQ